MTGLLEKIQRRLDRLEFILTTAEQMTLETGRDVDTDLIRFAAKKAMEWNRKRVAMGLPEYW
jgi:hypothetical protein